MSTPPRVFLPPEQWAELTVPDPAPAVRVDRFVADHSPLVASRAAARKIASRGHLRMDGQPVESSRWVRAGAVVSVGVPLPKVAIWEMDLAFAHVDPHMAVVIKPPGLPTSSTHMLRTLTAALPPHLPKSDQADAVPDARPVHRLDARTGGLVVVARTGRALVALGHAFEQRKVHKRYRAMLAGRLEGSGTIDAPIDGRSARSRYVVRAHVPSVPAGFLTVVDLFPETGRKHQLRRHMAELGTPVLGDGRYGGGGPGLGRKGLYLWAVGLRLPHPLTGEPLSVEIDEPGKFATRRRWALKRWFAWRAGQRAGAGPVAGEE